MFKSVMVILPWPQLPEKTMSTSSPKPFHVHVHEHRHHHHHVGVGTLLAALGGIFVVQYSIVAWVLITNPASLRIFLETMRGAPATSMVPPYTKETMRGAPATSMVPPPYTNGEHTGP
jgi:hypothetical protein